MDWAEELKMSIKKTTARKGRRSKSRDMLKEKTTKNSSSTSSPIGNKAKEISIDITLDLQQNSDSLSGITSSTATPLKPTTLRDKVPPVRRITGGWADSSLNVLKSSKSKRISYDDDRFKLAIINSATSSPPEDDIPVIPDLDDIKDETISVELESPSSSIKVKSPKEFNADLLSQKAFKDIGVDLSILTHCLHTPEIDLDEADEVWDWDKVFIDVVAEINSNKPRSGSAQQIKIGPDEVPTLMH